MGSSLGAIVSTHSKRMTENPLPLIGISVGDPAGIGPEITAKALDDPGIYRICRPFAVGEAELMREAVSFSGLSRPVHAIDEPGQGVYDGTRINVLDLRNVDGRRIAHQTVSAETGRASYEYVARVIELAMAGKIDATVTGPINKEAIFAAGCIHSGHTEIFGELTGTKDYAMMLAHEDFRVIHVTTHVSLRKACDLIKKDRVLSVIRLADSTLKKMGMERPRIGVWGLNPHAGEGGLFNNEVVEQAMAQPAGAAATDGRIEVPMPDLAKRDLLYLKDISRSLSGKVIGPKAANLGELNRLFPGRVAPAIAIPFGIYAAHLEEAGLMQRIEAAFAGRDAATLTTDEVSAELASVRSAISGMQLSADTRAALDAAMEKEFGAAGSYGVFVRSDTNVEDLPQFTGAGLNETIANVVDVDKQLAAIPRVWSSVLSPRALAWRSSVLANPAQIYASVLLMKSVPSTKSGVLVTTNLFDRNADGLSASVAWGVGGAVAGEAAESIVIFDDSAELIFEAKSAYQRNLSATGGVEMLPANAGSVLQPPEIQQLRELAAEVNMKYASVLDENGAPRPWDIEFGFVDGELTLFQIRPLVEKTSRNSDALLRRLRPDLASVPENIVVQLDEAPAGIAE